LPMISEFEILRGTIAKHDEVKVYIQGFARAKDGTGVWNAFEAHYLSASQLYDIAESAVLQIGN
jgi:hypothetical protein